MKSYIFLFNFFYAAVIFAQMPPPKRIKTKEFDYSLLYNQNSAAQTYSLSIYTPSDAIQNVTILEIWVGNEYRNLSECNQSFSPTVPTDLELFITKKHKRNRIGKPPFVSKGHLLIVYTINGKKKYKVLNDPQIFNLKPVPNYHVETPPALPQPCRYELPSYQ